MSRRTPYLLAGLVVLLGAALWALEALRPSPEKLARRALLPFAAREVDRVELQWPQETAALSRQGTGWQLTRPAAPPKRADARAVEAALAEMDLLSQAGRISGGRPGPEHGLAPPHVTVRLAGHDRQAAIAFGSEASPGRIFASVDEALFLVPGRARDLWGKRAGDLRDRRLLPFDPETLTEARVGDQVVTRRGRRWVLARPRGARADAHAVQDLRGLLGSLRQGEGATLEIEVVDSSGRHRTSGPIAPDDAQRLKEAVARLRAARPAYLPGAIIEVVEIREGARQLKLKRVDDGWQLPDGTAAEHGLVRSLLGQIHRLEAREVLGPEAASRAEPVERIVAWEARGERDELRLGPRRGARRAVRFTGEEAVYLFDDGAWALASSDPLAWRRRVVWELPPAAIEALALGDAEARRDESFRWVRRRPASAPLEAARAEKLSRALASPRVLRFVAAGDPEARDLGPLTPLRVETIDGEARTWHTLEVGRAAHGGGRLARVGAQVLVIEESLWRQAWEVLEGRAARQ